MTHIQLVRVLSLLDQSGEGADVQPHIQDLTVEALPALFQASFLIAQILSKAHSNLQPFSTVQSL